MSRLGVLGIVLVGLTLAALGAGVWPGRDPGNPFGEWSFRIPLILSVPVYFLAVRAVLRPGQMAATGWVIGVAVVLRLALLAGPPMLSSDIYRYVWDGRVQDAGINPYLHVPADPALAGLRDAAIYPHINRADYAPTIYPPAAQVVFAAVSAVSDSVIGMKIAMVALEAVAMGCLWHVLRRLGRPGSHLLVYAWNPVTVWEFAGSGHVDAEVVGLLAVALVLLAAPGRGRSFLAGLAFGAAVLVKFLPVVVAPALWRRGRAGWPFVAGAVLIAVALYGFYSVFDGAGLKVLGFLRDYGTEEGIADGSGFWAVAGLEMLFDVPAWMARCYLVLAACLLLGLGAWIAFRHRPAIGSAAETARLFADTGVLAGALMLVLSPHYSWYFAWLALPCVIAPSRAAIWLSATSLLLYWQPWPGHFLWPGLVFGPALLLAVFDLRAARAPSSLPALQGLIS